MDGQILENSSQNYFEIEKNRQNCIPIIPD
jgi:hypothetical protein